MTIQQRIEEAGEKEELIALRNNSDNPQYDYMPYAGSVKIAGMTIEAIKIISELEERVKKLEERLSKIEQRIY